MTLTPIIVFRCLISDAGFGRVNARWNWAMASQRLGGRRIGLNFGGQWTDGTGMTENAIFVDGQMTKVHEDVVFSLMTMKFYMTPWKIRTKFSE